MLLFLLVLLVDYAFNVIGFLTLVIDLTVMHAGWIGVHPHLSVAVRSLSLKSILKFLFEGVLALLNLLSFLFGKELVLLLLNCLHVLNILSNHVLLGISSRFNRHLLSRNQS